MVCGKQGIVDIVSGSRPRGGGARESVLHDKRSAQGGRAVEGGGELGELSAAGCG